MRAILALLTRSLQEESRAISTYLWRLGILIAVLSGLATSSRIATLMGSPGLWFFQWTAYANLSFISLAAIGVFATAITEEKREGTLGLLRMTRLGPLSILLGKSSSRLLTGAQLLLLQVPFTLLAVTLGGVSVPQILASYMCLGAFLFLVANIGLFFSVVCPNSRQAGTWTLVLLLALFFAPSALGFFGTLLLNLELVDHEFIFTVNWVKDFLAQASPATGLYMTLNNPTGQASLITHPVWIQFVAGLIFFALSWLAFERFNREELGSRGEGFSWSKKVRPSRTPWRRALMWKDFNFVVGGRNMLWGKTFAYTLLTAGIALMVYKSSDPGLETFGVIVMIIFMIVFLVESTVIIGTTFQSEIRAQALPTLALLPHSTRRFAYEKILGSCISLAPCLLFFVLGCATSPRLFAEGVDDLFLQAPEEGFLLVSAVLYFYHLVAYLSLWLRRGAIVAAIGIMICLFLGMTAALALTFASAGGGIDPDVIPIVISIGGLIGSVFFHFKIGTRLRKLAAA